MNTDKTDANKESRKVGIFSSLPAFLIKFLGVLCALAVSAQAKMNILDGNLQSDLNAGGHSITNVATISARTNDADHMTGNQTNQFVTADYADSLTNNLANTNGTYPNMTVGAATTALGGWPTQHSWNEITNPPPFGTLSESNSITSNNISGQINFGQVYGVPPFLTSVTSNNISGYLNYGQIYGVPAFLTLVTSNDVSGQLNYGQIYGTPTLGNAAAGDTNTMKVYAASNADYATRASTNTGITDASRIAGILPQYPTVQIGTNTPFANGVLISPDGMNWAWSAAYQQYGYTVPKYIGVTNYPMVSGDHVVYGVGTNQRVSLVTGLTGYECLVWNTNTVGSIIITNAGNSVLGSLSRTITNGQKFYGNTADGVNY
jgi:hypothetical protein